MNENIERIPGVDGKRSSLFSEEFPGLCQFSSWGTVEVQGAAAVAEPEVSGFVPRLIRLTARVWLFWRSHTLHRRPTGSKIESRTAVHVHVQDPVRVQNY